MSKVQATTFLCWLLKVQAARPHWDDGDAEPLLQSLGAGQVSFQLLSLHDLAAVVLILVVGRALPRLVAGLELLWGSEKTAMKATRVLAIDAYRGFLMSSVMIFHFAWDLKWFGLARMQNVVQPYWLAMLTFLVFFLTGHMLCWATGRYSPCVGAVLYTAGAWVSVTMCKTVCRQVGVHLFCMCAGAVTALRRSSGGFLAWQLRRALKVAAGAAAMSWATWALLGPDLMIRFGVLHMLASALLLQLLLPPSWSAPLALVLLTLSALRLQPEPEMVLRGPKCLDYEPVFINLGFLLLGDALQQHFPKVLEALEEGKAEEGLFGFFTRVGQWSLPLFLGHQLLLLPLAAMLRYAATGRWPLHVSYSVSL
ncbi:unnamed protein product [Effrenium voratum]|nr:unnamed protein product [Effrenium voratum]|mmetsp:Transcript_49958/g.119202  ORF Transcript_49958/g.119202 Transcript_49958/m.119202 type:complete len:367 (+) Transcript_49958:65-1165(+)